MLPYYTQKRKCLSCDSALMAPAELYNCFFMQCFWIFFFLCVNLREAESLKNRKIYYYVCRLYCFRVRIQRRQAPHQCGVGPGSIYIFSPIFCLIFENLKHKILLFFYNFSFFFFFVVAGKTAVWNRFVRSGLYCAVVVDLRMRNSRGTGGLRLYLRKRCEI